MVRTNIVLDDKLVAQALRLTRARSKRDVVDIALRELVSSRKRPDLRKLFGVGGLDPEYDHRKLRLRR